MKEKDVVQLLQFYRHDLMNHLQLIQGYLSMRRIEKVEESVTKMMDYFNEERKLLSLNAPQFILWVIQFNNLNVDVRLTYSIHIENRNLHAIDQALVEQCEQIIECIKMSKIHTELYEVNLDLNKTPDKSIIEVSFSIDDRFNVDKFNKNLESMEQFFLVNIEKSTAGMMCNFLVSCN